MRKKCLQFPLEDAKISSCVEVFPTDTDYFDIGEVFGLPNIKSAKKRVLVAEARNARNKADKSALKTAIKKFEAAAVEGNRTEAEGTYKVAVKAIDKAAAKGLLHKNNAAHKKSALTLKLNNIG
jgi:small subunit ribosomal protein S20